MGKHAKKGKHPRLTKFLKIFFLTGISAVLLGAGVGYGYIKYVENRLHGSNGDNNKNFKKAQKVISKPLPKEPINFLLVGTDAAEKGNRSRTDSIIFARLIPREKKGILIFIPRDFRVKIPGMGYNKINAAYAYGGPSLTIETIEGMTGFDIHHYAQIDFRGFKKMVDVLGGVWINVDKPIIDKSRMYRMFIPAGYQKFNGETALNYVRYRHDQKGDFGRIERQQKFLNALGDQVFKLRSVLMWPKLINIFADNAQTDLSTTEMLKFVNLFRSLDQNNLQMVSLPGSPKSVNGVSYVIPDEEKIGEILEAVRQSSPIEQFDQKETTSVPRNSVKIEVLNGMGEIGLAEKVKRKLNSLGFIVVATANAESFDHKNTKILYDSSTDYPKALKVKKFFDGAELKYSKASLEKGVDVLVIVGKNYAVQ